MLHQNASVDGSPAVSHAGVSGRLVMISTFGSREMSTGHLPVTPVIDTDERRAHDAYHGLVPLGTWSRSESKPTGSGRPSSGRNSVFRGRPQGPAQLLTAITFPESSGQARTCVPPTRWQPPRWSRDN